MKITYNKSTIMKKAWQLYKRAVENAKMFKTRQYNPASKKFKLIVASFADSLKQAWAIAKREVAAVVEKAQRKAEYAAKTTQEKIEYVEGLMFAHKMKDHWDASDFEYYRRLSAEHARLVKGVQAA